MKVALINKFFPPIVGGIEYHVRTLAHNLEKIDDIERIHILVANDHCSLKKESITDKIDVLRVPNWRTIASTPIAPGLIGAIRDVDADILHFHFPYPFGDFAKLVSGCKKPYVITYHSDVLRQRVLNKLYTPLRDRFFRSADKIITTSPNLRDNSAVLCRFKEKVQVIPLGIDPGPYVADSIVKIGRQIKSEMFKNRPVILFVGRLVYYKGVDVLVKAFKELQSQDAQLVIIGDGVLKASLVNYAQEQGLSGRIHFFSGLSDQELAAYFNACDIFVLPSVANTEAFGLVQLEAQAAGKPVISTNLPTGVPFVNKDGVTGLIVEPGDIGALTNAMQKMLDDVSLRERIGQQGQHRMLAEFTDAIMAKRVHTLYQEVLFNK